MTKPYKPQILLCITIAFAVLIAGCSTNQPINSNFHMGVQIGQNGRISKIYDTFSGIERGTLDVASGQRICFDYEAIVQKGSLTLKWLDPNGAVVWQRVLSESASGIEEIISELQGRYTIVIHGQSTVGSFTIAWIGE